MKSIRGYLIVAVLSAIVLMSFLAALHGYRRSVAAAEALFDRQLADTAGLLLALYGTGQEPRLASGVPEPSMTQSRIATQFWSDEQQLLRRSGNAPDMPMAPFVAGFHERNFASQRWRILTKRDATTGTWVMVAEPAAQRYLLADSVVLEAVIATLLEIPITALLIWLIIGYGLRPLRRLAAQLRGKQASDLSAIELADPPEELVVVTAAINALLSRLDDALAREKRLTADAAHELRTPITALKVHLHNLSSRLPEKDPVLALLNSEIARLEHLVEQILMLYRMSPDQYRAHMETVNLTELAREAIARGYPEFEQRHQTVALQGSPRRVTGDRFALSVLLTNLLDNARKYGPAGGQIGVAVAAVPGGTTLSVRDSGPGLPAHERQRVFERFYRVGGDRHASNTTGSGLGLSIVQLIAELHGATVRFDAGPAGQGLEVQVHFPDAGDPTVSAERCSPAIRAKPESPPPGRRGGLLRGPALFLAAGSAAATPPEFEIDIVNHLFEPSQVTIPAHTKVRLVIHNRDPSPEEFESWELNREKVIMGNSRATIYVGPLRPGEYPFFGEFNPRTALGTVIVE